MRSTASFLVRYRIPLIKSYTMDAKGGITTADINLTVQCDGLDEIYAKAQQIRDKMEEARTLAGELASMLDGLEMNIDSGNRETREIEFCVDGKKITQDILATTYDTRQDKPS